LAVVLAGSARASVLLDEPFNYNNGGLVSKSAGNWTAYASPGLNAVQVSNGAATVVHNKNADSEDVARSFASSDITTGSLFLSFTFKVNTAPTTGSDNFLGILPAGTFAEPRGRVILSGPGTAGAGRFRIGLSNIGGAATVSSGDLTAGTQYVALLAVDAATNLSRMWVGTDMSAFTANAPLLSDPTPVPAPVGLASVFLRQGKAIALPNSMSIDNIRVGTAFSDFVTTAVPEASSFLILGAMGAAVGVGRAARRVYRG
jgi:hypothetical protein